MFVRHDRLPRICRRSSLFQQLVFGVQSVKVVRKPCKNISRILSINCGSRVVWGLNCFECLQVKTSSFPRATDSEANRVSVFLACKTAPNSRRSSLFRQTMQFWIWYMQPKWILWNFWHWHSCKVCKQGDVVLGRGQASKSTCSRVHRKQFVL